MPADSAKDAHGDCVMVDPKRCAGGTLNLTTLPSPAALRVTSVCKAPCFNGEDGVVLADLGQLAWTICSVGD